MTDAAQLGTATGIVVIWILVVYIPWKAYSKMATARDEGRLQTKAFEARMGWLCGAIRPVVFGGSF